MQVRFHLESIQKVTDYDPCDKYLFGNGARNYYQIISEFKNLRAGMILLESAPQTRIMHFMWGNKNTYKVSFPYLYHLISYRFAENKEGDQVFIYEGIYGACLRVFMSKTRVNSFDRFVIPCPTDSHNREFQKLLGCTDHDFDFSFYENLPSLVNQALDLWWSASHAFYHPQLNLNDWVNLSPEEVNKYSWNQYSLMDQIETTGESSYYSSNYRKLVNNFIPPKNSTFFDISWKDFTTTKTVV